MSVITLLSFSIFFWTTFGLTIMCTNVLPNEYLFASQHRMADRHGSVKSLRKLLSSSICQWYATGICYVLRMQKNNLR
jgi:hypothetical protein